MLLLWSRPNTEQLRLKKSVWVASAVPTCSKILQLYKRKMLFDKGIQPQISCLGINSYGCQDTAVILLQILF